MKNDFILLVLCHGMVQVVLLMEKALGFYAVKLEWIYHVNSCNFSCVQTLYKYTFDANNQLAPRIICTKHMANHICMASQQSFTRPSWSVV